MYIYILLTISRSILLRMRNVSDKIYRKNLNTHFGFNFFVEDCAMYDIMWKNIVQTDRQQMTINCDACALCTG